jgi:phosphate transport system substrate-binding protein
MASFAATHRSQAELLAETAKDPASLALGGIRDAEGVRPLSLIINGNVVIPSETAFLAGEYPLVRPLTLVFDKSLIEADNGLRREILSYVLSRQGQEEVLRAGFFPVNPNFIAQQMASFSKSQLR